MKKKIIVCSLKHSAHINKIIEKIQNSKYANDYSLFIDDEGDDISQNTSTEKFKYDINGIPGEYKRSKNLEPGEEYTGLITFHSAESPYVQKIDDYECLLDENGIPESLMDACAFFFAGCIYRLKNLKTKNHAMMIHPDKRIAIHQSVATKLRERLKFEKFNIENSGENTNFYKKINNYYKEIDSIGTIELNDVKKVFSNHRVNVINGKSAEKDIKKYISVLDYNIFIGGDLLDRGITIDNLAVTYIIRDSLVGQVDTLQQRGRWFGYKRSYLNTCRIYMPESLAEKYTEMIETEDSLWDFLSDCSERKIDLKTMDPHLMIDSSILKPTSASKALYEFDYKNISSTKQQRNFTMNSSDNEENKTLVQNLTWIKANELKYNEVQNHRYIDLNHQEITDFVLNYKFSDYNYSESYLNKKVCLKYIDDNIQKYGNTVSVVDMRYKTGETRRVSEENVIKAIMQGRSEGKKAGDKDFYYGDARLPEFKNKISLQIHHVLIKNDTLKYKKGDEVIVLVLCMPGDFVIQNCVHRKKINFL